MLKWFRWEVLYKKNKTVEYFNAYSVFYHTLILFPSTFVISLSAYLVITYLLPVLFCTVPPPPQHF